MAAEVVRPSHHPNLPKPPLTHGGAAIAAVESRAVCDADAELLHVLRRVRSACEYGGIACMGGACEVADWVYGEQLPDVASIHDDDVFACLCCMVSVVAAVVMGLNDQRVGAGFASTMVIWGAYGVREGIRWVGLGPVRWSGGGGVEERGFGGVVVRLTTTVYCAGVLCFLRTCLVSNCRHLAGRPQTLVGWKYTAQAVCLIVVAIGQCSASIYFWAVDRHSVAIWAGLSASAAVVLAVYFRGQYHEYNDVHLGCVSLVLPFHAHPSAPPVHMSSPPTPY